MENEEKRIKRELNNVDVHADPKFKQQSYQKTLEALRESKQAKPRRSNKSRYAKAGAGLIAAAAIGGLLVISNPELTNLFTSNGENGGTQQTTDNVAIEDLPQYIDVEHGDDTMTFELYDEPELLFVTYLPKDFETYYMSLEDDKYQWISFHIGWEELEYGGNNPDASGVFQGGISLIHDTDLETHLEEITNEPMDNSEEIQSLIGENNDWFLRSFLSEDVPGVMSETIIGEKDEDLFMINGVYHADDVEEWQMMRMTFIREWRWRDTGEKLMK
ncbi:hypothetical protein FLK61_39570 [Paenalkalicoccus suaedae]|uniref:Uncharacterized protein n=1 Tax=Paenalkalicoccus suaedae TaxID=2592382 RepID=A0A859FJB6_9BACI|nr:hypothetical protein [Paenalkalicoccus suaedae]QKS72715.1 hypothetical protein FLK61_39570 [Paenalkalicoccus suaedae]